MGEFADDTIERDLDVMEAEDLFGSGHWIDRGTFGGLYGPDVPAPRISRRPRTGKELARREAFDEDTKGTA